MSFVRCRDIYSVPIFDLRKQDS